MEKNKFREDNKEDLVVLDSKEVREWEKENNIKIEYLNEIDYLNMIKELKNRKVWRV